jgi:hypothetical protein
MNEQLNILRKKEKINEYDVNYAEKQLEILQKQIALEEAKNNKSQMRLQRNAAGNYDFVYAANEDQVNNLAQELLNAQQEAYNMSREMNAKIYEELYQAAQNTENMIIQIITDTSLGVDEQKKRIEYLLTSLGEYATNAGEELTNVQINLYNDFIQAEQLIEDENLGKLEEIYTTLKRLATQYEASLDESLTKRQEAYNDYYSNLSETSNST